MKRYVSVFGCVAVMMGVGDPASARTHHRHLTASKHSHHHSWAYAHHVRYGRAYRLAVPAAPTQPFAPELSWQAAPTIYAPIPRQKSVRQSLPAPYTAPAVQPSVAAPFGAAPIAAAPVAAAPSGWRAPRVAHAERQGTPAQFKSLVSQHAQANGLPESLVHRVIMRESRYNPRVISRGNYGIMQIRLGTARAMGYSGSAAGLLDANTNMTYAVRYLAGAYRAAGGNADRAVSYYARGYYYQAKRAGFSAYSMRRL